MTITLVEEISAALDTVTEHEIERAKSKLEAVKKGEKKLGTVYDPSTIRLYALAWHYAHKGLALKQKAEWETTNEIDRQEQLAQSTRLAALAMVCQQLCIAAAKFEVGHQALSDDMEDDVHLHLRSGFVVASHKRTRTDIFQAIIGGETE